MAVKCQQCGASYEANKLLNGEICPACEQPYNIKNYRTVAAMPPPQVNKYITTIQTQLAANPTDNALNSALGICFLRLKLHDKALPFFEKAMEDNFSDPEPYYYAAVCLLKGKKAFLAMRPEIESTEKYLDAAISLEPRGVFYYFKAYVKIDYYERKHLSSKPSSGELIESARQNGLSEDEKTGFYELLGVERPSGI